MNYSAIMDYHIHTKLCRHAVGETEQYIARAIKLGFKEIGISDHLPMYFLDEIPKKLDLAMSEQELPGYVEQILSLRDKFPELTVKLAIEADYIPEQENRLADLLNQYPFDYVLGSVHFVDGWAFDHPGLMERYNNLKISDLYRRYYSILQQAAASGLFDILAHPDLIKKFNFQLDDDLSEIYRQTAKVIKKSDVCLEINTSGLRYPVAEIYPSPEILQLAAELDIPVTLGSDSHKPEQVGKDFDLAINLLKETGIRHLAFFSQRQRELRDIQHCIIDSL